LLDREVSNKSFTKLHRMANAPFLFSPLCKKNKYMYSLKV